MSRSFLMIMIYGAGYCRMMKALAPKYAVDLMKE
jgi:hypothetical protein